MDKDSTLSDTSESMVNLEVSPEQYQALKGLLAHLGVTGNATNKIAPKEVSIDDDKTVDELWELTWKEYYMKDKSSDWKTVQAPALYRTKIKPKFGNTRISKVTPGAIRKWKDEHEEEAPVSWNRAMAVFKTMINHCMAYEHIPHITRSPFHGIKKFTEKPRERFATDEEIRKITLAMTEIRSQHPEQVLFFFFMMFTAARPSYLLRLKWGDIRIGLDQKGREVGLLGWDTDIEAKNDSSKRLVVPAIAMTMLKSLKKGKAEDKIFPFKEVPRRIWKKITKKAGVSGLVARDLRRTFATVARSKGLRIDQVSDLLGHADSRTTEKIYAKVDTTSKVDASSLVADILGEITGLE